MFSRWTASNIYNSNNNDVTLTRIINMSPPSITLSILAEKWHSLLIQFTVFVLFSIQY